MKIPMSPPDKPEYDKQLFVALFMQSNKSIRATTDKGEYLHWDKLRHLLPPFDLSHEQWWLAVKFARKTLYTVLPFIDKNNKPFVLATPDSVLYKLHSIDRSSGNYVQSPELVLNKHMKDAYVVQSLIEESITSSQLEGASTTRKVAKEMLRTNRKPRDFSEKMIFNNYQAMLFVRDIKNEALTPDIILELHRIITKDTMEDQATVGAIRTSNDVHIWDNSDQILHTPPDYKELDERLKKICEFANAKEDDNGIFMHPIIKAILLHFMLAYDHPFVDGNGRIARVLFYWSMAHQGYWLMEFVSISEIIKRATMQYARAYLYTETDDNDTTYFIVHQLDVILKSIEVLHRYINEQSREISETENLIYANHILQNKINHRQIAIIMHALKHPHMHYQIEGHRLSHNITYDTARTDLSKLSDLGLLLKQKTGKSFTFVAPVDLKRRIQNIT